MTITRLIQKIKALHKSKEGINQYIIKQLDNQRCNMLFYIKNMLKTHISTSKLNFY